MYKTDDPKTVLSTGAACLQEEMTAFFCLNHTFSVFFWALCLCDCECVRCYFDCALIEGTERCVLRIFLQTCMNKIINQLL